MDVGSRGDCIIPSLVALRSSILEGTRSVRLRRCGLKPIPFFYCLHEMAWLGAMNGYSQMTMERSRVMRLGSPRMPVTK